MTVKSYISEMSICTLGRLLSVRFWENPRKPPVRFCLPPSSSTGPKSKIKRITFSSFILGSLRLPTNTWEAKAARTKCSEPLAKFVSNTIPK